MNSFLKWWTFNFCGGRDFLKQEKERSALNQHSLDSFVLLPADNTHTHIHMHVHRHTLVCLAPCG